MSNEDGKNNLRSKKSVPSLNKFMHPRNIYRTPPSFRKLAIEYPEFRAFCSNDLKGKVHLDFKNPEALAALTTCLFNKDFDLKVKIPTGRLVPTLPLRLNYLLWIEDLLSIYRTSKESTVVMGIDIGTGSTCVYPLLAAKKFGWCMLATEADDINYESAIDNVNANNLQDNIIVTKVENDVIFKGILDNSEVIKKIRNLKKNLENKSLKDSNEDDKNATENKCSGVFDFLMCNPPFFSCIEELNSNGKSLRNRGVPISAPTGSTQEKMTFGGEVQFVTNMMQESVYFKDSVRIFSTLLGTKADLLKLKNVLQDIKPAHFSETEFCQGRTMRWGIAWTFENKLSLKRVISKKKKSSATPMILLVPRSLMAEYSVSATWNKVNSWMNDLKVKVRVYKSTKYFVGASLKAYKATWLHQRRKKREHLRKGEKMVHNFEENKVQESINNDVSCVVLPLKRSLSSKEEIESEDNINEDANFMEEEHACKKKKLTLSDMNEDLSVKTLFDPVNNCCSQNKMNEPDDENKKESEDAGLKISGTVFSKFSFDQIYEKKMSQGTLLPECALQCNLYIKMINNQISIELMFLGGISGKDGLNQLLQYIKNQLHK